MKAKEEIVAEIEQRWIENIGAERMQMLKEDLTTFINKEKHREIIIEHTTCLVNKNSI